MQLSNLRYFLNANKNYDSQWNEIGGGDFNLRYENYDNFFLRSRLSIKISPPLTTEETNRFTPHLRIGWLADWNTSNSDVEVQNIYNNNAHLLQLIKSTGMD